MSNRPSDKLFDFFRSKFGETAHSGKDWPLPPDDVFENAMIEIGALDTARKRERRRVVITLLMAALALVIIASVGVHLHQLNEKLRELEDIVVDVSLDDAGTSLSQLPAEPPASLNNSELSSIPAEGQNADPHDSPNKPKGAIARTGRPNAPGVNEAPRANIRQESDVQMEYSTDPTENATGLNPESSVPDSRAEIVSEERIPVETYLLSQIEVEPISESAIAIQPDVVADLYMSKDIRGFSLGVTATTNASSLSMSGIPDGPPALTGYDAFYWGGGVTASLNYRFNKRWSINTDLSYARIVNRSRLLDEYMYDSANEGVDNNGESMYTDQIDQETPIGPQPGQILFYTEGQKIPHGQMMAKMGTNEQLLHTWSASLGGQYFLINETKFGLSIGAGVSLSGITKTKNNMHAELYYSGELVTELTEETSNRGKCNKVFGSAYGDVRAIFNINRDLAVIGGLRYARSFTSLRQAGQDEPSTYLTQVIPSIGFQYKLNKSNTK